MLSIRIDHQQRMRNAKEFENCMSNKFYQMSGKNNLTYKVIQSCYFPFSLFKIKFLKLKSLVYCLPYAKAERIK